MQTKGLHLGDPRLPAFAGLQVPLAVAPRVARQVSQLSLQGLVQHTPSTQWPDWHCAASVQEAPLARRGTHEGALQV